MVTHDALQERRSPIDHIARRTKHYEPDTRNYLGTRYELTTLGLRVRDRLSNFRRFPEASFSRACNAWVCIAEPRASRRNPLKQSAAPPTGTSGTRSCKHPAANAESS